MPKGYWTKERCAEEARKYSNHKEFREVSSAAADFARRKGWLNEICSHMEYINKPNGYWTKERCIEALKHITTLEQLKKATDLYAILYYHGWMEELTKHIPRSKKTNGYWTIERCAEDAKKCNTRNEFKHQHSIAYNKARKMGWLDEICTHMVSGRVKR